MAEVFGSGCTLSIGSAVGQVTNLEYGSSVGAIDVPLTLDATCKRRGIGVTDNGPLSGTLNYDPALHTTLTALLATPTAQTVTVTLTDDDTTTITGSGFLSKFSLKGIEREGVLTADFEVTFLGEVTIAAAD